MGFAVSYRSTRPVGPAKAEAIDRATDVLCRGHTWLSSEPVNFHRDQDGYLSGASKPNMMPDPQEAAEAAREGLPDGSTRDVLDILCQLSRELGVDWEIRHDFSNGPVGSIRKGVADGSVVGLMEVMADAIDDYLGDIKSEAEEILDDDDEPPILPFRPKGG